MIRWAATVWTLAGCTPEPVSDPDAPRAIVIVLDGIPGDVMIDLPGEARPGALNRGVPTTTEAHTALLTGRRQPLATFGPGQLGVWRSTTPTLPELLTAERDLDPDRQLLALGNTVLLDEAITSRAPHLGSGYGPPMVFEDRSDAAILDRLTTRLGQDDIHFALVNLHQMDIAAHEGDDYTAALESLSAPLSALWQWIERTPPYASHTRLMILSDHGRHDWGEAEDWWNHGDACLGCRETLLHDTSPAPDAPIDLTDIATELADWLEVPLPLASGSPRQLPGDVTVRDGQIWRAGAQLSAPDALAEAPRWHNTSADDLLCWRELPAAEGGWQRWRPRCVTEAGADWPLPFEAVSPFWEPAIDGDWLAGHDNLTERAGASGIHLQVYRHGQVTTGPELSYPQGVTLSVQGPDEAWIAAACSADEASGRDSRQVSVWSVSWPADGTTSWSEVATLPPPEDAGRVSSPRLQGTQLAALSWPLAGGIALIKAELPSGSWQQVPGAGPVFGHIPPLWDGDGGLWWASQPTPESVAVCRQADEGPRGCVLYPARSADVLRRDGDGVLINLWDGTSWSSQPVTLPQD
ncbi:MAG: hypothetical protein ACI8S6_000584 [Myxococcota bacterium]|jgi:hypothetical protein